MPSRQSPKERRNRYEHKNCLRAPRAEDPRGDPRRPTQTHARRRRVNSLTAINRYRNKLHRIHPGYFYFSGLGVSREVVVING